MYTEANKDLSLVSAEFIKRGEWNKNLELWWCRKFGYFWTLRNGHAINGTYKAVAKT